MSLARRMTMAVALATAGCGDAAPAVEVSTYVGPTHARNDEQLGREHAHEVAGTVLAGLWPRSHPAMADAAAPADALVHPPADPEQFARLAEALRHAPPDEIGGPARRLAVAGPPVWPQIRQALLAERTLPRGDYRSLLDAIGGDVPNRYGHFARTWQKAHGFTVKLSQNWFEDLLLLPPGRVGRRLQAVYRDCVLQTALLRAATAVGRDEPALTGEVIATLLDAAYAHDSTFRDEVGRAIVGVGDEAIPHLLLESHDPAPRRAANKRDPEDPAARRAEYALLQLDKMDRLHPERATLAVRDDPRQLVRVLDAYAVVRPGEAAAVLLGLVDVDDPSVRAAARAAFTAYVEGPPPTAQARTIRILGGGTSTARAHLTYRQRAGIAIRERMQADAPELLEPACEVRREDGTIDRWCEGQPERLTRAYLARLDTERRARDERAILASLAEPDAQRRVAELDRLLAGNPALAEGERLVPVYREAADAALAQGDAVRAGQLLRKAAQLAERDDPNHGQALRVQALLAEASVPVLGREGRRMLLTSAQELAPADPRVLAALEQLERSEAGVRPGRWAPLAGMVAGLWGLGLVGSWWRRRRGTAVA
jgi:hypothetical protein